MEHEVLEVCQGFYITPLEPLGSPMRWKPLLPPFCRWVNGGFAGWMTWVEAIRTGIQVPFCLTHGLNGTATGDAGGEAGEGVCRVPGQTRAYKTCHIAGFLQKQSVMFCVCVVICVLVCFSVASRVRVGSLWACGYVSLGVSVSSSLCISRSGIGRVTIVISLISYSLYSGGGSLPSGSWWWRLSACRPQLDELVKVSIQSSRGPESPWGHLGKVSELHLGSFIFEGTVYWINERNGDFLEVPKRSYLFLRRRGRDGNLFEALVLYGWSVYWQPVALHSVSGKAGFLFSRAAHYRMSLGGDWDTPHLGKQVQASDDLEGWDSQLESQGSQVQGTALSTRQLREEKRTSKLLGVPLQSVSSMNSWLAATGRRDKRERTSIYIDCLMRLVLISYCFIPKGYV